MLQLTGNLCVPHKAFHKLQLIVLVGLDFCNAHAGVRRRRRCDFSETPPPIHLATADKPAVAQVCPWLLIGIVKYVAFDVKVKVLTKLKTRLTMLSFVMRGLVP